MLEAWPNYKEQQTQTCNGKMSDKPNYGHQHLCRGKRIRT